MDGIEFIKIHQPALSNLDCSDPSCKLPKSQRLKEDLFSMKSIHHDTFCFQHFRNAIIGPIKGGRVSSVKVKYFAMSNVKVAFKNYDVANRRSTVLQLTS